MTFSQEWDEIYANQQHISIWPWTDLISLCLRHCRPKEGLKVLELGCGTGANIPFFKSLGANYFSIEGSPIAVERLRAEYPEYADQIVVGDFTVDIPFKDTFDLVVDRSSLTHNTTEAIRRSLKLVHNHLESAGALIGIDWFSTKFNEMNEGILDEDEFSRRGFETGKLTGVGVAHFFDEPHLIDILSNFDIEVLEHKTVNRHRPNDGWQYAAWNFVARKKESSRS